jgi:hypothetical protein
MSVSYFFLRLKKPAAKEPNPSKPSNGSGEAVWGSFCPASAFAFALWSAAGAWSAAVAFLSLSEDVALWSAAAALLAGAAFWSVPVVLLAGGFWAVVLEAAAFWSVLVLLEGAALALLGVVVLEAALWSVVLVLEVDVLGAVALEAAAFWSAELVPVAGGFTGALALSPCAGAWVVLVVAAGALALLVSVVGACALPAGAGVVLLAEVEGEAALWSLADAGAEVVEALEAGAAALAADWSAAEVPAAAPAPAAWLFVRSQKSYWLSWPAMSHHWSAFPGLGPGVHHAASAWSCRPVNSRSGRYQLQAPSSRRTVSGSPSWNWIGRWWPTCS